MLKPAKLAILSSLGQWCLRSTTITLWLLPSFTNDGWFITGDRAFIDFFGRLRLSGRAKESVLINGVKHFPRELETAIEEAGINGVVPSYTAVFPHRPKGSQTEMLCVAYLPSYDGNNVELRVSTKDAITEVAMRQCSVRPYRIIPLEKNLLAKSSLGKLSRTKIRNSFESGAYLKCQEIDDKAVQSYRVANRQTKPKISSRLPLLTCLILRETRLGLTAAYLITVLAPWRFSG